MRTSIVVVVAILAGASAWVVVSRAQQRQPQATPASSQPQSPGANPQPGITRSLDELKQTAAQTRAGRKLTPKSWPNGSRVAVCLSFDIDNESGLLARELNPLPTPLSEGEYGATEGLPRILALLDRERVPASFYIPAVSAALAPDMVPAIVRAGRHEIALHGWIHESLPALNDAAQEERLLNQSIEYLTKASGKRPVGNRAGAWALSHYSVDILRKAGLLYDSSMMAMDEPYELMANGRDTGIVELPVEWIQDDAPYFGRTGALPSPEMIFRVYQDEFDLAYKEGTMLMLTFHPHVSGHRSRIVHLEKLIEYMKAKPGVWFATAEDIARYVKQSPASTN
ncbi:MAG TPA: polysaccharide deacetylase [Vicinamibacterales bacterium]|nr:polysaccharide deacetylase [Vicinamibacterales bacterium]